MLLVYMHVSLALGCLVIFLAAYYVAKDIRDNAIALLSYGTTNSLDTLDISVVSQTSQTKFTHSQVQVKDNRKASVWSSISNRVLVWN